jgi:hypothetical protein
LGAYLDFKPATKEGLDPPPYISSQPHALVMEMFSSGQTPNTSCCASMCRRMEGFAQKDTWHADIIRFVVVLKFEYLITVEE